jgi:hypothetical protein
MTIPEAVALVLVSGLNDCGELCILEMGEPVRIADPAHHFITMAGFVPGLEIPIVYSGLRPGEKLHEELMTEEEEQTRAVRNRILTARCPPPPDDLAARLEELRAGRAGGAAGAPRGHAGARADLPHADVGAGGGEGGAGGCLHRPGASGRCAAVRAGWRCGGGLVPDAGGAGVDCALVPVVAGLCAPSESFTPPSTGT